MAPLAVSYILISVSSRVYPLLTARIAMHQCAAYLSVQWISLYEACRIFIALFEGEGFSPQSQRIIELGVEGEVSGGFWRGAFFDDIKH